MRTSGNSMRPPSRQHLGDLGPAVSQHAVGFVDDKILFWGPGGLLHVRVEVVVPALAALFPQSPLQVFGHHSPLFITVFIHQLDHLHTQQKPRVTRAFQIKTHTQSFRHNNIVFIHNLNCSEAHRNKITLLSGSSKSFWIKEKLGLVISERFNSHCIQNQEKHHTAQTQRQFWSTFSSSSLVQGPLTRSGSKTLYQRCWHWCSERF